MTLVNLSETLAARLQNLAQREHRSIDDVLEELLDRYEPVPTYHTLTRDELLRYAEILRRTPPRPGDSLLGKYANPDAPDMSEDAFHAQMHIIAGVARRLGAPLISSDPLITSAAIVKMVW